MTISTRCLGSNMESPSAARPYHYTERTSGDRHQIDRWMLIIKSLRLGQVFYSIALVWVEIIFLVAWITPPTPLNEGISPGEQAQHVLTLLTGLLSNIHLILWHLSSTFRTWEKTIVVDLTFSVIWSFLTAAAVYSFRWTKQNDSLGLSSDAVSRRVYVVLVSVLALGSATFIAESVVDQFPGWWGVQGRTKYGNAEKEETGSLPQQSCLVKAESGF
ncbi:hypothetical protein F5Y16DRAFT_387656 [Xylariaceae sp. FL0255]|nr:hypothetical protein F5Y16DRAFT_387656 [Xylariaceae sp. FL0255]